MNYNYEKQKLEEILLSKDIYKALKENENLIFDIIPELKYEKGFNQKSEWHCYDVWNHTVQALINSDDNIEIRLALLLHDIGKPFSYQEEGDIRHFKNHAEKSAEISKNILARLKYSEDEILWLCFLIKNHATAIKEENLNENNIEYYKKLLYIQYCDASAYAPMYSKQIIDNLTLVKKMIETKESSYKTRKIKFEK